MALSMKLMKFSIPQRQRETSQRQSEPSVRLGSLRPVSCAPVQQQQQQEVDWGTIMCEPCGGRGWLVCGFCKGQKTNVKAENKRIYRRCPDCKAVGYVLCSKCKVFKCVTFPDYSDVGEDI